MKICAMKTILVLGFSLVWIAGASAQKGPESPVQSEQGAQKAPMPMGASTIQGELLKIEGATDGAFYTVKDPSGKEVRLHVNKETRMDPALKVGETIEAQSNTSGHALTIKKSSSGASGGRSDSGMRGMEP
jgi:hypothetical protein